MSNLYRIINTINLQNMISRTDMYTARKLMILMSRPHVSVFSYNILNRGVTTRVSYYSRNNKALLSVLLVPIYLQRNATSSNMRERLQKRSTYTFLTRELTVTLNMRINNMRIRVVLSLSLRYTVLITAAHRRIISNTLRLLPNFLRNVIHLVRMIALVY